VIYRGEAYTNGRILIGPPDASRLRHIQVAEDVRASFPFWLEAALKRDDIVYFTIYFDKTPAGQILLHDLNPETGESLVAYPLFDPALRGQGTGTAALRLLQQYVIEHTRLARLVIITSRDNQASQRIAQKCGFVLAGAPREDPVNRVVYQWIAAK
jgi:RimJ/RimL family protein N-acetyltransferase